MKRMLGMNSRGQAIVKPASVIFLLLLLVSGIFEFGRAMYTDNTLTGFRGCVPDFISVPTTRCEDTAMRYEYINKV